MDDNLKKIQEYRELVWAMHEHKPEEKKLAVYPYENIKRREHAFDVDIFSTGLSGGLEIVSKIQQARPDLVEVTLPVIESAVKNNTDRFAVDSIFGYVEYFPHNQLINLALNNEQTAKTVLPMIDKWIGNNNKHYVASNLIKIGETYPSMQDDVMKTFEKLVKTSKNFNSGEFIAFAPSGGSLYAKGAKIAIDASSAKKWKKSNMLRTAMTNALKLPNDTKNTIENVAEVFEKCDFVQKDDKAYSRFVGDVMTIAMEKGRTISNSKKIMELLNDQRINRRVVASRLIENSADTFSTFAKTYKWLGHEMDDKTSKYLTIHQNNTLKLVDKVTEKTNFDTKDRSHLSIELKKFDRILYPENREVSQKISNKLKVPKVAEAFYGIFKKRELANG